VKRWFVIGALLLLPRGAGAAPLHLYAEPVQVGLERLDAMHAVSGLQSRSAVRLGGALGVAIGAHLQVGIAAGTAAGGTDFGLLAGPQARLVRTDVTLEARGRLPYAWHGFGMQGGLGVGWLRFDYQPDRITLDAEGTPIVVELEPVGAWTRQIAAEVLHGIPGGEMGLRAAWRFYALDVSTPAGIESRSARDLQLGMLVRVTLF
jgi:hypothetical protein